MTKPARYPRPQPTPLDTPYWESLANGKLRVQRCAQCHSYNWYPRPVCSVCYSEELKWDEVEPVGTLYSYTVTHQRTGFAFDESLPFVVGIIELADAPGVRLVAQVRDLTGDPEIGARLRGEIRIIEAGETSHGILEFRPES